MADTLLLLRARVEADGVFMSDTACMPESDRGVSDGLFLMPIGVSLFILGDLSVAEGGEIGIRSPHFGPECAICKRLQSYIILPNC